MATLSQAPPHHDDDRHSYGSSGGGGLPASRSSDTDAEGGVPRRQPVTSASKQAAVADIATVPLSSAVHTSLSVAVGSGCVKEVPAAGGMFTNLISAALSVEKGIVLVLGAIESVSTLFSHLLQSDCEPQVREGVACLLQLCNALAQSTCARQEQLGELFDVVLPELMHMLSTSNDCDLLAVVCHVIAAVFAAGNGPAAHIPRAPEQLSIVDALIALIDRHPGSEKLCQAVCTALHAVVKDAPLHVNPSPIEGVVSLVELLRVFVLVTSYHRDCAVIAELAVATLAGPANKHVYTSRVLYVDTVGLCAAAVRAHPRNSTVWHNALIVFGAAAAMASSRDRVMASDCEILRLMAAHYDDYSTDGQAVALAGWIWRFMAHAEPAAANVLRELKVAAFVERAVAAHAGLYPVLRQLAAEVAVALGT